MSVTVERSVTEVSAAPGETVEVTVSVTADEASIALLFEESSDPGTVAITEAGTGSDGVELVTEGQSWVGLVTETPADSVSLTYTADVTAGPGEEAQLGGTVVTATGEITTGGTTVAVEDSLPPIVGDNPPQDLNGDGLYRDVNGDGAFTIGDVQAFFEARNDDVVQNNPECFNFDGRDPTAVSIADVQALFQDYQQRD